MRRIEGNGEKFNLIIEGTEGSHLRGGPENLVYRAAQRVWKVAGLSPVGLEARVNLAVPPARGLGSSATAIVAGLVYFLSVIFLSRKFFIIHFLIHFWKCRGIGCKWIPCN